MAGTALKAPPLEDRVDKFIELFPKHKYRVAPAAMAAGYAKSYAYKNAKMILATALQRKIDRAAQQKELAKDLTTRQEVSSKELKESLIELMGLTSEEVKKEYRGIVTQNVDRSTKLKALMPLLRELGIIFSNDQNSTTTPPIMNITVNQAPESERPRIREAGTALEVPVSIADGTEGPNDGEVRE